MNFKARFGAFWTRFGVAFSGALFLLVPAVAWLLGCNVGNAILWVTGLVLLAYTIETQGMRLEIVRQNEIAVQPLLIISIEDRPDSPPPIRFILRNIGRGPALFVQVKDFELNVAYPPDRMAIEFRVVDCVEPGRDVELEATMVIGSGMGAPRQLLAAWVDPRRIDDSLDITITCEDIDGQPRWSKVEMGGKGGTRLLDHGKGAVPQSE